MSGLAWWVARNGGIKSACIFFGDLNDRWSFVGNASGHATELTNGLTIPTNAFHLIRDGRFVGQVTVCGTIAEAGTAEELLHVLAAERRARQGDDDAYQYGA
jgi:hypothetical protein